MSKIDMSTWTEAERAEYAALDASIAEETGKTELTEAKREAERLSPANVLAERKADLAAQRKAAALAATELEADVAFRKALAEHGGKERVARIHTEEGSIILRAMTLAEVDESAAIVEGLASNSDKLATVRDAIAATVLFPSRATFDATVSKWPGLWTFLAMARDAMVAGIREDTAKKG